MVNIINKVTELNAELSDFLKELTSDNLSNNKKRLSNTLAYLIENLIELSNELDQLEKFFWIKENRYYKIIFQSTLFGTMDIICAWGRIGGNLGNYKVIPSKNNNLTMIYHWVILGR
jgi:hypothetical protein